MAFRPNLPPRVAAPLVSGALFLGILCLQAKAYFGSAKGIPGLVASGASHEAPKTFLLQYFGFRILPIYLAVSLLVWWATFAWGQRVAKVGPEGIGRGLERFFLSFSGLMWIHLIYWCQSPGALVFLPLLDRLPMVIALVMIGVLALAYPLGWAWVRIGSFRRRMACVTGWLALWTTLAWLPQVLPRHLMPSQTSAESCEFLWVGIDGLRGDVYQEHASAFSGRTYLNAYTPVPSTRLLWHLLWGGDPEHYTSGHVIPDEAETLHPKPLHLLQKAAAAGWKPRFFIDDGGTIDLHGEANGVDAFEAPARGWQNFVHSNLAGSFPLVANWENWLATFPTTNPWSQLDAGLREAIRRGRGSRWVMFHSCQAHQPIYLRRQEWMQFPRWWRLKAYQLEPFVARQQIRRWERNHPDDRLDPFDMYRVRMHSLLVAWRPIWNSLEKDANYRAATRVLFSDHGERFYAPVRGIQLMGVHGYDLDPWECRVALTVAGGAFPSTAGETPSNKTLSLLALRDLVEWKLAAGVPLEPNAFEMRYPKAPFRYQGLSRNGLMDEPAIYRNLAVETLGQRCITLPSGRWYLNKGPVAWPAGSQVTVGFAEGDRMDIFKPLRLGGAHHQAYVGYTAVPMEEGFLDPAAHEAIRTQVDRVLGISRRDAAGPSPQAASR